MSADERTGSQNSAVSLDRERQALSLLRRAGRRAAPPQDVSERVHAALLETWSEEVRHRRRVKYRAALAAGIAALALGAGAWYWQQSVAVMHVAHVTRLSAPVTVMRAGASQRMSEPFQLRTGDSIRVPSGSSLAAQRGDGVSLRISGPAYLVWDAPNRLRLDEGRVYVDVSRRDANAEPFEVRTPLARIEHIGTRFVAEATAFRVRVAVRDGRVRMTSTNGAALGLRRGQAAEAIANGQIAWLSPPGHAEWEWVDALAPPCGIEGRSLYDVLQDLAREADLELAYASPDVERRARELTLHGPALDLPPRAAIDAVLDTTDLDADLTLQRVLLRMRVTTST